MHRPTRAAVVTLIATLFAAGCGSVTQPAESSPQTPPLKVDVDAYRWSKLPTEAYKGKQDDIFFIDPQVGWYVNGAGKIFKTTDGGATWTLKLHKPGTFFRCIVFLDAKRGFAGNIGPDYFPNVSDATPMYETRDGGETWTAVTSIRGPMPKGLCAFDVVREPYINAGNLDEKVVIHAAGRVGSPAFILTSDDNGETWTSVDMSAHCAMILDVKFLDRHVGFISAGTNAKVAESHALILRTTDGGKTWARVYESQRPYELTWKSSFPSAKVGYVTVQNYNPDKTVTQRVVAKTTDGGTTWSEVPLSNDYAVREFGVAFANEEVGWIGTTTTGFVTRNGGATWSPVDFGKAVNKIRVLRTPDGIVAYAIGVDVYKLAPKL